MIFVFIEDGALDVIANLEEAQRNYEGIDVESGVFQFFDEKGIYLEPQFTEPNRTGRFLGIIKWVESGKFNLVPQTETDEDINLYLAETSEINPNPFFSSLDEVRQFLQGNRSKQNLSHK
jgi:hypothetical protein